MEYNESTFPKTLAVGGPHSPLQAPAASFDTSAEPEKIACLPLSSTERLGIDIIIASL
jgi:hypothetical protein